MKITGELLKSERLNLKLSVQDIASALKLSSKIIKAIEAGDVDNLPAKTFVRGFVKSYALFLKLDANVVLRQFQEEMGSTNPLPKVPPPMSVQNENNLRSSRPALRQTSQNYSSKNPSAHISALKNGNQKSIVLMVSIAIILIAVLLISNKIIDNYNSNPVVVAAPPAAATSTTVETADKKPAPPPATPSAIASTSINASADQTSTISSKASSDTTQANVESTPTMKELGFSPSAGQPIEILLEAKKDVELFYAKGDSTEFKSIKLIAEQAQILRSNAGLYLKAADGGAFKISVNGISKGLAGKPNKEVKLSF